MNLIRLTFVRNTGLIAGLIAGIAAGPARGADKLQPDAFPAFDSYIKVTGLVPSVTGHDAAFAQRQQSPADGTYGIEAIHVAKDTDKGSLEFNGRALTGAEDYLGAFKFAKEEFGSFEFGYKRFRTFYDGIGGFFPLNNRWMQLGNPELHTDRASFWVGAKIERPNAPKFEFRYTNDERTGRKDTTIWGDTDFTGVPAYYGVGASALNPYSSNRKIVPAYIKLNERQQNWLGKVTHTVGNTELELELVHNTATSKDTRWVSRYPGELQLYPRQSSSTNPPKVYPPETISNEVQGYDRQNVDSKINSATGKFETKVSDTVTLYGGLILSKGDADIGGDRQMTQYYPTAVGLVKTIGGFVGAGGRPPYSYTTVKGETNEKVFSANFGVKYQPSQALFSTLAIKYEKTDVDGSNLVNYVSNSINQTTGAVTPIVVAAPNVADRTEKSWIPELTFRYTGFNNVSFYGDIDYRHSPGTEYGNSTGVTTGGGLGAPSVSDDNVKLNHAHYKVGANWTVNRVLSLRGELFYKDHTNGFYDRATPGDGFVLGYQFYGEKFTAIVKPQSNLTFTTRLIHQSGKMDVTVDSGASMDSNDTKNYNLGETIDWSPTKNLYLQANINAVYNTIKTAYPVAGGAANDVLRNSDNNYVSGSFITGFAVDKETDASIQYTYYRADNYNVPTNATLFYGAGVKEYTVAFVVKHKFTDKFLGEFKIGYFDSENQTTGGNTNFRGPLAYVSVTHAL
ncbi:MAG TPA: hypothetical protein VL200_14555 [Lacunisphaera sp.]|jgi:hypothetical protein|nr:hypothetical protein [Lacunisphaera sp.]